MNDYKPFTDEYYLNKACWLAGMTKGQTNPNPSVGALVVKDNQIVGMGTHLQAGGHHAEIYALNMAASRAQNAVLYVSLEPCSHQGKTPPCVHAIIVAGIKKVVVATLDPNPLVSGKGLAILQQAGIETILLPIPHEDIDGQVLNQSFNYHIVQQKPFVTLKVAISLDGKIVGADGNSKWLSNDEARADAHQYRHQHTAILVGVETIIKDNPSLTTRLPTGKGRNPIRLILDTHLRTPLSSQVLTDSQASTWIIVGKGVPAHKISSYQSTLVTVMVMDTDNIELDNLLVLLYKKGIDSILVEGGARVLSSFIKNKVYNQLVLYISPCLIGGAITKALPFFQDETIQKFDQRMLLRTRKITRLQDNIKITLTP
ncbi:MAG: bifunctional diaminohydroxyphosphoribosylaminopyrimidine deaminase/5-amino-6-(5-phosphoribosylamino)uracil reductase RibD [Phycisphaerales bacterium]|nr:bifunctional diaminohydroxyphosphoribosylaminopyrimidine deaminase/5-amino-6-(5-phosphoribosylamino)uracil reductase RibD [Phycisphaerales bacterium]